VFASRWIADAVISVWVNFEIIPRTGLDHGIDHHGAVLPMYVIIAATVNQ
jgi:hypothetical protein